MNKIRFLVTIFVCSLAVLSINVHAQQVNMSSAQSIAAKFMHDKNMGAVDASKTLQVPRSTIDASQGGVAYYVFNAKDDKGFVIVSGDSRTEKILGYCDHGSFDYEIIPENMKGLLGQYAAQINQSNHAAPPSTKADGNIVHPLIKTQWGQDQPFNLKCPDLNGEYCLTGSTATALAQVMYYYRWPSSLTSIPGYYTATHNIHCPYYNCGDIDWDNMQLFYPRHFGSENNPADVAVAKLMRSCAQAVRADFDTSFVPATDFVETIEYWLHFSRKARQVWRCDYTPSEWENFILTELHAGRPVLYTADTHDGSWSQSFICDGYDGNGYYHFNWGNRGLYDGYYKLEALNPSINNMPFDYSLQFSQRMIIGLEPDNVPTNEQNSVAEVTACGYGSDTYIRQSNGRFSIRIGANVLNNNPAMSRTFDLGWEVLNADGHTHIASYFDLVSDTTLSYNQSMTFFRNLNFGYGYADGTYILRPICRETGNSKWYVCHKSGLNYIRADIKGDTLKLSVLDHKRSDSGVNAQIMYYNSVKQKGALLNVYVKVDNIDRMDEEIPLYLWATPPQGGSALELVGGTTVHVPRGSSNMAIISFYPKRAGSTAIVISPRNDVVWLNTTSSYYCHAGINIDNLGAFIFSATNRALDANANNVIYGNTFKLESVITSEGGNDYYNYIYAKLFTMVKLSDGSYYKGYLVSESRQEVYLPAHGTKTIYFNFENLPPNVYFAEVYSVNYYNFEDGPVKKFISSSPRYRIGDPCDVNCDGSVNANDLTVLYNYILKKDTSYYITCDVNFDGAVNSNDVTIIYNRLLGND